MALIEPLDIEKVQAENPQSRFRLTDNASLKPGVCSLCGSAGGDGRQFIDFGKTMDWYGVIYFCTFCVAEAAAFLGLLNASELLLELERHSEAIQRFGTENAELQETLDAAMVLVRNCTCSDSGIGLPPVEITEADIVEPGDSEPESESADVDESDADESAPVEGSDDIPADSGDDEFTASGKPRASRSRKSTG